MRRLSLVDVCCLVLAVSSFWLMYVYWRIGVDLETQLLTCLEAR
jgi:hypothetical protein